MVAGGGVEQTVQGHGPSDMRREREAGNFLIAIATGNGVISFDERHRVEVIAGGAEHPVKGAHVGRVGFGNEAAFPFALIAKIVDGVVALCIGERIEVVARRPKKAVQWRG